MALTEEQRVYFREKNRCYRRDNIKTSGFKQQLAATDSGEAGELLVAVDLLKRGLQVTKPVNRSVKDDLHVKCTRGWVTIQSKVARFNSKTGVIQRAGSVKQITSDIIAWVDLYSLRIRYEAHKTALPKELR